MQGMKFKKGDEVVFVKNRFVGKWPERDERNPIGSIGKVVALRSVSSEVPYFVEFPSSPNYDYQYNEEELELLTGCDITRVGKSKRK